MPQYTITLEYEGKQHSFLDTFDYQGWDEHRNADYQVTYMYSEGNYGCDCNRSHFIAEHCDEDFPDMECGRKIKLVSIKEGDRALPIDQDDAPPVYQLAASGLWLPS